MTIIVGFEIEADAAMANQTSEAHGSVRGDETDPGRLETNGRKHFQQGKRVACSAQFMDLGFFCPSATWNPYPLFSIASP